MLNGYYQNHNQKAVSILNESRKQWQIKIHEDSCEYLQECCSKVSGPKILRPLSNVRGVHELALNLLVVKRYRMFCVFNFQKGKTTLHLKSIDY